ncbi:MAG: SH3 domain-containing protein [Lachnospiraceae bacterium]|jgi:spore germination cell wall hydrolase CwlJ-like protein|nr:SH3 domain-containing protein [Lachnospiraceae bacterium]MCI9135399.1 SH3 domain-containing protein [Lachnospiraceae bacterium]
MNLASKKWLLCLAMCLTWLSLCGFEGLEVETTAGVGSLMDQLTGEDIEEFRILEEWEDRVIANIDDYVNVRAEANAESKVVGRLFKGDGGYILERAEGWTRIKSGNVEGYVSNDYLLFGTDAYERAQEELTLVATATTNGLRIRNEASTESKILKNVEKGTKLVVVSVEEPEEAPEEPEEELLEASGEAEIAVEPVEDGEAAAQTENGEEAAAQESGEEAEAMEAEAGNDAVLTAQAMSYTVPEEETQPAPDAAEWICVQYAEEKTGYVSAEYVTVQYELGEGMTIEEIKQKEAEEKREKLRQQLAAFKANGNEVVLLAALIQAEAGGQPYEGKVAVGAVVMNRVKSGRYPNSIADVIYAPGQFGPASNGALARYLGGPSASCMQAAQDAINGYTTIGTYTHFRRAGSDVGGDSIVIGSHVFY